MSFTKLPVWSTKLSVSFTRQSDSPFAAAPVVTAALAALVVAAVLSALSPATAAAADDFTVPSGDSALTGLDRQHPRLILKADRLAELKKLLESDPIAQRLAKDVIRAADGELKKPPPVYHKIGPRLLSVSRDTLHRIYRLGLAWRLTGNEAYARKAREILLAVCDFQDWNPSHFLDTAEMSHAVGVGYDWLYSWLEAADREKIKAALIRLGLEEGLKVYRTKGWWAKSAFNWNQVCNGGMMIGALAIAESDPDYARRIIPAAVESMPLALTTYAPDGAWPEGPGYWGYATSYTVYALAALDSALGRDFGLSKAPGLDQAGLFPLYLAGPTGLDLNYADAGENSRRGPLPCLFWLARRYGMSVLAESEHEVLRKHSGDPLHLIWYTPPPAATPKPLDLDRHFGGPVELALFRSGWDAEALFVGIKAGYNQVNHGHLDLGNFEMDALGVRWARDLGSDDYDLPGYFSGGKKAKRWTYYRLNSLSHNVLLLNDQSQDVAGKAHMLRYKPGPSPSAVIDLTSAYRDHASKVTRGLALVQDRRAVLVQDELEVPGPCKVAWGMTTSAEIKLDKDQAVLTQQGKELRARILSPAGAVFASESAEQAPPQKTNAGVRRLMIRLDEPKGSVRIVVLLSPAWPDGKQEAPPKLTPLAEW